MIAFLNFILVILLVVFIVDRVVPSPIYRSFSNLKRRFTTGFGGAARGGQGGRGASSATDEVIIDRRAPGEAGRKIFSKDEGEYVDFEEEK